MKRAAILCPGPSLARAPLGLIGERHGADGPTSRPIFDLVLAVNTAGNACPVDVWVFQDPAAWPITVAEGGLPVARLEGEIGPALATRSELSRCVNEPGSAEWFARDAGPGKLIKTELIDDTWQPRDRPPAFRMWSSTVALVVAAALGASSIEVWGHDLEGANNYRGKPAMLRDAERWAKERHYWALLRAWLEGRGVGLTVHRPGAEPLAIQEAGGAAGSPATARGAGAAA